MSGRTTKIGPRARRAEAARLARAGAEQASAASAADAKDGKDGKAPPKKKVDTKAAWRDARALMWQHRRALGIGFSLMLVSRVTGLVLPRELQVAHRRGHREVAQRAAAAARGRLPSSRR